MATERGPRGEDIAAIQAEQLELSLVDSAWQVALQKFTGLTVKELGLMVKFLDNPDNAMITGITTGNMAKPLPELPKRGKATFDMSMTLMSIENIFDSSPDASPEYFTTENMVHLLRSRWVDMIDLYRELSELDSDPRETGAAAYECTAFLVILSLSERKHSSDEVLRFQIRSLVEEISQARATLSKGDQPELKEIPIQLKPPEARRLAPRPDKIKN